MKDKFLKILCKTLIVIAITLILSFIASIYLVTKFQPETQKSTQEAEVALSGNREICFIATCGEVSGGWQRYTVINREGQLITAFGVPNLEQGEEVQILFPKDSSATDKDEFSLIAR